MSASRSLNTASGFVPSGSAVQAGVGPSNDAVTRLDNGIRNLTDETRIGIQCSQAVGWLRQEENQYLSMPFDIAREIPVDLLRLMGYEEALFTLGYMDDMRDPMHAVRQGEHESIVDLDTAFVSLGRAFGGDAETSAGGDEA
jgi:hypothetical protein